MTFKTDDEMQTMLNYTTSFTSGDVMSPSNATAPGSKDGGDQQWENLRLICEVWLSMPIALAGIVGNILSLIVLCNHKQMLTTTVVLQALAVVDTMVLISTLLLRSFRYVGIPQYEGFTRLVFPWLFPSTYVIRLVDTWLTVILTVDRYIAVCHPLHAQHLCTIRRTYVIIVVMVTAVVAFCVPRYFEYETVSFSESETGFRARPLMANRTYAIAYCILAFFVVMYLIPMTILTVLNAWILVALRRSNAQRNSILGFHQGASSASTNSGRHVGNNRSSSTRTVTLIAVTIVLICIACNVMAMVAHVIYSLQIAFRQTLGYLEPYRRHLANYSNVLITLNSSVNFVVYCAFSRKFQNVFVRMCRKRLRCVDCCRGSTQKLDTEMYTDSTRRSICSNRFSQVTKHISVTSTRSPSKRGTISIDEREAEFLWESSVL